MFDAWSLVEEFDHPVAQKEKIPAYRILDDDMFRAILAHAEEMVVLQEHEEQTVTLEDVPPDCRLFFSEIVQLFRRRKDIFELAHKHNREVTRAKDRADRRAILEAVRKWFQRRVYNPDGLLPARHPVRCVFRISTEGPASDRKWRTV